MTDQTTKRPFVVSRLDAADWVPGLRADFEYRDLGIKAATNGEWVAQTIRVVDNGTDHDVSKHHHDIQVAPFAYVMALLAFSAFLILLGLIFRFFRTPFDGAER